MPRGSRSSPFLYCSPLKMIIRKTAWKSSLTLFISISSADAVCSLMRNTHGETLVVFKDTERKTSAEVLTDSSLQFKDFLTFFLTCHHFFFFFLFIREVGESFCL